MSEALKKVLEANSEFQGRFDDYGSLTAYPRTRITILTCMDARIDPLAITGMKTGDIHVIRNAGGRASDDAIRSLLLSAKFLRTTDWFVIHHTECGMEAIDDHQVSELFAGSVGPCERMGDGWSNMTSEPGSAEGSNINWQSISSQPGTLISDARRVRRHPLVSKKIRVSALMYDVRNGKLTDYSERI